MGNPIRLPTHNRQPRLICGAFCLSFFYSQLLVYLIINKYADSILKLWNSIITTEQVTSKPFVGIILCAAILLINILVLHFRARQDYRLLPVFRSSPITSIAPTGLKKIIYFSKYALYFCAMLFAFAGVSLSKSPVHSSDELYSPSTYSLIKRVLFPKQQYIFAIRTIVKPSVTSKHGSLQPSTS